MQSWVQGGQKLYQSNMPANGGRGFIFGITKMEIEKINQIKNGLVQVFKIRPSIVELDFRVIIKKIDFQPNEIRPILISFFGIVTLTSH